MAEKQETKVTETVTDASSEKKKLFDEKKGLEKKSESIDRKVRKINKEEITKIQLDIDMIKEKRRKDLKEEPNRTIAWVMEREAALKALRQEKEKLHNEV